MLKIDTIRYLYKDVPDEKLLEMARPIQHMSGLTVPEDYYAFAELVMRKFCPRKEDCHVENPPLEINH